jgi:hypothetical protein
MEKILGLPVMKVSSMGSTVEPDRCREPSRGPGSTLEQTAIHEAAHVVIATLLSWGIVEEVFVSDTPVDVGDAFDELNTADYGFMGGTRFRRQMQTTLFQQGLIAYSGFYAQCEQLFRDGVDLAPLLPQLRSQASHDVDRYLELLFSENLSERQIQRVVVDIGTTLKHYFDNGAWEFIERVAEALLQRRHLTGDEVLDLLPGLS